MINELDCSLKVSKFKLEWHSYIHFLTNTLGKGMKPLILPAMIQIVLQLFFYKDDFGINLCGLFKPTKVDMPLNKRTKTFCWPFFKNILWTVHKIPRSSFMISTFPVFFSWTPWRVLDFFSDFIHWFSP